MTYSPGFHADAYLSLVRELQVVLPSVSCLRYWTGFSRISRPRITGNCSFIMALRWPRRILSMGWHFLVAQLIHASVSVRLLGVFLPDPSGGKHTTHCGGHLQAR